ncbi:MAG: pyridoxamine 5'-phosphate oxidase [Bacteroidetes bacterium]|nr:pyridoxamine 5'-phosphate oxidase [Bacteroidota bacterium]
MPLTRNTRFSLKSRQAGKDHLTEELKKEPIEQFRAWFDDAKRNHEYEPEAMALATADKKGRPSVRMVLFRDVSEGGFCFFTNWGSRKGLQLKSNPYASVLFYWPKQYRQVRVEGRIKKAAAELSDKYFNSRPLGSRISACISPQSAVVPDRIFLEAMHEAFSKDLGREDPRRPKNWGGIILVPNRFEFWTGRENRLHDRIQYRKGTKGWIVERLAP